MVVQSGLAAIGARALIEALLVGAKEFSALWQIDSSAIGYPAESDSPAYRSTVAWLQKKRLAGEIVLKRGGRSAAWQLTEAVRAAFTSAERAS